MNEPTIIETVPDYLSEINQCDSLEDFTTLGLSIRSEKDKTQWLLGILALRVEGRYGESSLSGFAKNIGISVSSLQIYRWTVKNFLEENPDFIPPAIVPFGILQVAAKLPTEERIKMVESVANGEYMTIERARAESKRIQGKEEEIRPEFHVNFCKEHNSWLFYMKDSKKWHTH